MMNINDMIETARNFAKSNGEALDAYWGEYLSVMKLLAAYYGGMNSASDMGNFNRVRGQ